jgi:hypothetical protein
MKYTQHVSRQLKGPTRKIRTFASAMNLLEKEITRMAVADGLIIDPADRPPRARWGWGYNAEGGVVLADTRSQARSLVKKALGVTGRLPSTVTLIRIGSNP